jgi:hypothetical protein
VIQLGVLVGYWAARGALRAALRRLKLERRPDGRMIA